MPSIGSICRSITITSGRRPSESIDASSSSASAAPAASPTTSMSGSVSRNASKPSRTMSWSSTISTRMASSRPAPISGSVRFSGDADSYERPGPRLAPDRDPGADLGRAAAHRVEAEVIGVPPVGVETAPVVADLDDNLPLLGLDPNVRRARPGVLLDVQERLPPDVEELGFDELRQPEPRPRPADV